MYATKGKGSGSQPPSDTSKDKLVLYVYEFLVHSGAPKAAQQFLAEIKWDRNIPLGEAPGFLQSWWSVFWDLYSAAPERRDSLEHSSEARAFHDLGFINSGYSNGNTHGGLSHTAAPGPMGPAPMRHDPMRSGYFQQQQFMGRFAGPPRPQAPQMRMPNDYPGHHGGQMPMHGVDMQPGGHHQVVGMVHPRMPQQMQYGMRGPAPPQPMHNGLQAPGPMPVGAGGMTHMVQPTNHVMPQPMAQAAGGPPRHWVPAAAAGPGCTTPMLNSPHDSTASSDMYMVARNNMQQAFQADALQTAMVANDLGSVSASQQPMAPPQPPMMAANGANPQDHLLDGSLGPPGNAIKPSAMGASAQGIAMATAAMGPGTPLDDGSQHGQGSCSGGFSMSDYSAGDGMGQGESDFLKIKESVVEEARQFEKNTVQDGSGGDGGPSNACAGDYFLN